MSCFVCNILLSPSMKLSRILQLPTDEFETLFPIVDRILLISWLLKDFGWMTTNYLLSFPFGIISITLHLTIVILDPRSTFKYYNYTLLAWIIGNFLWMLIEVWVTTASSSIHFGPKVPIDPNGMTNETIHSITYLKIGLFISAFLLQLYMYIGICLQYLEAPKDDGEDSGARKQLDDLLACNRYNLITSHTDNQQLLTNTVENSNQSNTPHAAGAGYSLVYVENVYIIFWIMKDLFWGFGTGDLTSNGGDVLFFEICALFFGAFALATYTISAYVYRHNSIRFIDCLSTMCWILANYVWMAGEFFIRYKDMELDDGTEGNDSRTRIASLCLFLSGILLQTYNSAVISVDLYMKRNSKFTVVSTNSPKNVEMTSL